MPRFALNRSVRGNRRVNECADTGDASEGGTGQETSADLRVIGRGDFHGMECGFLSIGFVSIASPL